MTPTEIRRRLVRWILAAVALAVPGVQPRLDAAIERSEWRRTQALTVTAPGLVKVALPAETLDALRPGAADLRLLDPSGEEVAWLLERPLLFAPEAAVRRPKSFEATLLPRATVLRIETGVTSSVAGLRLEGGTGSFLKAARVEGSMDGRSWQGLAEGVPFYRDYQGETRQQASLPPGRWAWLRVTLDDARTRPVPFTGAWLQVVAEGVPPVTLRPLRLLGRIEAPGETRITLDLGAANLDLAALRVVTPQAVFTRPAALQVEAGTGLETRWTMVARGMLDRGLTPEGTVPEAPARLEVGGPVPSRQAVLVLRNGDNPPLPVSAVEAEVLPVQLAFHAREAGRHELLLGHPSCPTPRYDLGSFADAFKAVPSTSARWGGLVDNPGYRPPPVLTDPFLLGATLRVEDWSRRRALVLTRDGAQQLELDLAVLAHARPDLGDLRLVSEGRQRPFLLEPGGAERHFTVRAESADDPREPGVSRWRLLLPYPGLPLTTLVVDSSSPILDRDVVLYEAVPGARGEGRDRVLSQGHWIRTPGGPRASLELSIPVRPTTDVLFLAIRDGNNAAIPIEGVHVACRVPRLRFLAPVTPVTSLCYGNPEAGMPEYDLRLVADRLRAADAAVASMLPEASSSTWGWRGLLGSAGGAWSFWLALSAAVVGLLWILRKLLPGEPPG